MRMSEDVGPSATADPSAEHSVSGHGKPRPLRRRRFLIHPLYQLRIGLLAATIVLLLLLFLNLSLYTVSVTGSKAMLEMAPELEGYIRAQDRAQLNLILLGSLVFLVGVFVVSILETHKTAGAAFNISRRMQEIEQGNYNSRLVLRRSDNLKELQRGFNNMARALRSRTYEEIETLQELAAQAEKLEENLTVEDMAAGIQAYVEQKRKLVERLG